MVKVAYILTPVEFGGSEKVNLTFLRNTNRERFNIHPILLVRPWENDNLFTRLIEEAEYSVSRIPVAVKQRHEGVDYFRVVRCILYLSQILLRGNFNLVHTHGYFADIIATPVCKFMRIPHVSTCHGFISNDMNLKLYNRIDRIMLRFCERIIAVSSEIKDQLEIWGLDGSKIVVIQNAIQIPYGNKEFEDHRINKRRQLSIEKDVFVIGYVGRLSKEKGVRYLIEAASELEKSGESFKIIILGDGPMRYELESLTEIRGLNRKIDFIGFQANIEEWWSALDVVVLPSLTEGTPMALLEAMSLGIPVIATAVGGVPKVIDNGIDGLLISPRDIQGLTEAILILKRDKGFRKKIAKSGVNKIKRTFNVNDWCHKIEEQYNLIIND